MSTPEKSPPVKYALLFLSDEFGAAICQLNLRRSSEYLSVRLNTIVRL